MSPRTIDFRINWETSMVFMMCSEWHRIPNAADDAERARLLRIPSGAPRRAHSGTGRSAVMFPSAHPDACPLHRGDQARARAVAGPDAGRPGRGARRSSVGRVRRLGARERSAAGRARRRRRPTATSTKSPKLLVDPDTVIASSDAGAHVQMMCAAGDTTLLLARHVRDRGDLGWNRRSTSSPAS